MINFLKIIFFFPIKIIKLLLIKLNNENFIDQQNLKFKNIGLSRELGIENLNKIRKKFNLEKREMSSEHEIAFSALSLLSDFKPKNILEIGTYDAHNVKLMSVLFKDAFIDTIDLDDNDEDFKNFYNRNSKVKIEKFLSERNKILKDLSHVKFFKKNSVKLLKENKTYDLIWIDGAHGYPTITMDIVNSLRLINHNGVILCDDIYLEDLAKPDKMYNSKGAHQTLEELKKNNLISYSLIFKRVNKEDLIFRKRRKFIAIIKNNFKN